MTKPKWLTPKPCGEQTILQFDHVVIFVVREAHVEAIAGFAGITVADVVGQNEEVFGGVEKLVETEENSSEGRCEELAARAAGPVKDQNSVADFAGGVFLRCAQSVVVELEFGESLAGFELEVFDGEICGLESRVIVGVSCYGGGKKEED